MLKNLPASGGDAGVIPGLGRSPRGGCGIPLQYSCLENPMDVSREQHQNMYTIKGETDYRPRLDA